MLRSATFISDVHLGIQDFATEKSKQKDLILTIEKAAENTDALFLVGDIFDYWFEYREVVPKGYTRLFGVLAKLTDAGFPVTYFSGNHDFWLGSYFEQELGISTRYTGLRTEINGKTFEIAHGDGLGPGDHGYKALKWLLTRRWSQWMYLKMHPDWGIGLARWASGTSRHYTENSVDYGESERLIQYSRQLAADKEFDYFVCGHRHIPKLLALSPSKSIYVNLGEWLFHRSFGVFNGDFMEIRQANGQLLLSELTLKKEPNHV